MAKSKSISIPDDIKAAVEQKVAAFNKARKMSFKVEFKKQYCYLSKVEASVSLSILAQLGFLGAVAAKPRETKLGRLTWTGDIEKWSFDVFKYSRENYDPNEFMFPGREHLDGTIEGALKAGIEIYP